MLITIVYHEYESVIKFSFPPSQLVAKTLPHALSVCYWEACFFRYLLLSVSLCLTSLSSRGLICHSCTYSFDKFLSYNMSLPQRPVNQPSVCFVHRSLSCFCPGFYLYCLCSVKWLCLVLCLWYFVSMCCVCKQGCMTINVLLLV